MSSNIYLTQTQIHDLFEPCETKKIEVKTLDIPSFGDDNSSQQSPEFQQEAYYFLSSCKKDENYTTNPTNNTNRHLSQDSIIELKDDTVRSMQQCIFSSVSKAEYESLKRDAQNYQALMKLNLKLKAHNQMKNQANSYQCTNYCYYESAQIYVAQECNKKLQGHIYELLQTIKILETENQQYSEDLLLLRLQIQDQLKIIQQGKIDIERLKITMIEKDESLIELQDNYKKLFKETERTKNSKSAQRSTYVSTHTSSPLFKGLSRICLNNYCNSSFVIEKQQ
ncbi:unnamed protein product (macronuclear) [Paramecium tetraurelia]|uniref:Uncharacterized protein n=1 Tax=Paramecium tetraurelia TaxID=5888 RepID=A0BQL2_PARTE|nr:uncharacterized protein GSPATT00031058001 [Paramecium tetraurelia]CAK60829.1 unnamed protein product [Paramecium tetraurelia]|eukprot:XP_001428227.1 hypothetical protein (macronuclear) [Paramecium tetraurelia strain d4-2]